MMIDSSASTVKTVRIADKSTLMFNAVGKCNCRAIAVMETSLMPPYLCMSEVKLGVDESIVQAQAKNLEVEEIVTSMPCR